MHTSFGAARVGRLKNAELASKKVTLARVWTSFARIQLAPNLVGFEMTRIRPERVRSKPVRPNWKRFLLSFGFVFVSFFNRLGSAGANEGGICYSIVSEFSWVRNPLDPTSLRSEFSWIWV